MAIAVQLDIEAKLSGSYSDTDTIFGDEIKRLGLRYATELRTGTGNNQADVAAFINATATAAPVNYDLDAGTITDPFGNAITFTEIRGLILRNKSTTGGEILTLSGDWLETTVLGGTTPTLIVHPSSTLIIESPIDGYAVTAGTADVLTVDPGANTIEYDLVLIGID